MGIIDITSVFSRVTAFWFQTAALLLCTILLIGSAGLNSAGEANWISIGPYGGSVTKIVVHPRVSNVIYLLSERGKLFKSVDASISWTSLPDVVTPFRDIVIASEMPDNVFVSTDLGVYRSTDGGQTWLAANNGLPKLRLRLTIDPRNADILYSHGAYFDTPQGIYKSTNAGNTWEDLGRPSPGDLRHLILDPFDSSTLYLSVSHLTAGGVFKSLDGGRTWVKASIGLTDPRVTILAADPLVQGVIYAGTDGGLFKSTDGANSWVAANGNLVVNMISALSVDPRNSRTVYVANNAGGVFKTVDGGAQWFGVHNGLSATQIGVLAVDPQRSQVVYAGAQAHGFFRTEDGGGLWASSNHGLSATSVGSLSVSESSPHIYAGTEVGLQIGNRPGLSWRPVPVSVTGIGAITLHPANPAILYVVDSHGILKSENGGTTWIRLLTNGIDTVYRKLSMNPKNPGIVYAGSAAHGGSHSYGVVVRSDDGGATWVRADTGLPSAGILSLVIDPLNPTTLYAGAKPRFGLHPGGLFKTTNSGLDWFPSSNGIRLDPVAPPNLITALSADPYRSGTVYAAMHNGSEQKNAVYKTTDGGLNWSASIDNLPQISALIVDLSNSDIVYAATSGGVYRSTNGGLTWTAFSSGLGNLEIGALAQDSLAPFTLYAGSLGGGAFTLNSGPLPSRPRRRP